MQESEVIQVLLKQIHINVNKLGRSLRIMEICGTHTVSLCQYGLHSVFQDEIEFLSGPGCPVCVTHQNFIDTAIELSKTHVIFTFGDLLRVPGSQSSLSAAKADGADIRLMLSPIEAVRQASAINRPCIIATIGFETTAPAFALAVKECERQQSGPIWFLNELKTMPSPMKYLLDKGLVVDGLLLPGHVAAVIGVEGFRFLEAYDIPAVVAGFSGEDILRGICMITEKIGIQDGHIGNAYTKVVRPEGNPVAQNIIASVFETGDAWFRGMGTLPGAGLVLRAQFANRRIDIAYPEEKASECRCADILTGQARPWQCPWFAAYCTPEHPQGSCMVSAEGACAAYFRFGRRVFG